MKTETFKWIPLIVLLVYLAGMFLTAFIAGRVGLRDDNAAIVSLIWPALVPLTVVGFLLWYSICRPIELAFEAGKKARAKKEGR
jgi:hypothetical protein